MPTRNVDLTEQCERFVESSVTSGRFSNPSEIVCEGLRLLEQREQEDAAKTEWLRAAAKTGFEDIENGDYLTLSTEAEIDTLINQIRREVSQKLAFEKVRG